MKASFTKALVAVFVLFTAFSQIVSSQSTKPIIYNSDYITKSKANFETDSKSRTITITDKEITISNFLGGTKTLYLVVNKNENKEWMFDGVCKTYYCTTRDEDPVNGYQKAIIYKTYDTLVMALFADEITVYTYKFHIN